MTIDEAEKIKTVFENKDCIVQLVNTVAKAMLEAFNNLNVEDVNMFQLGYDKAIDYFANTLKDNYDYLPQIFSKEAFDGYIDEYAEQLKEQKRTKKQQYMIGLISSKENYVVIANFITMNLIFAVVRYCQWKEP